MWCLHLIIRWSRSGEHSVYTPPSVGHYTNATSPTFSRVQSSILAVNWEFLMDNGQVQDNRIQPCLSKKKDIAVLNVPVKSGVVGCGVVCFSAWPGSSLFFPFFSFFPPTQVAKVCHLHSQIKAVAEGLDCKFCRLSRRVCLSQEMRALQVAMQTWQTSEKLKVEEYTRFSTLVDKFFGYGIELSKMKCRFDMEWYGNTRVDMRVYK